MRLQDLRRGHVLAVKTAVGRTLAPATVKTILGVLRQALEAAVTEELIARNPAVAVSNPSLAGATRERRALTEDEIAALLEAASGTELDAPIRFALATAASLWLRAGVEVFTVSRRLGHGSAAFTVDTYGHLLRGQQRAAAEALDHLLG